MPSLDFIPLTLRPAMKDDSSEKVLRSDKIGLFYKSVIEAAIERYNEAVSLIPPDKQLILQMSFMDSRTPHLISPFDSLFFFSFVYVLTNPTPNEGYVTLTLIRSKGLKEKFGFKGSDHKLGLRWIPAYHSWKRMGVHFLSAVLQECLRADMGLNVYWKYGDEEPVFVPSELIAIMMNPNPSEWIKASQKAVEEFVGGITAAYLNLYKKPNSEAARELANNVIPRVDIRLPANMMKYQRTVIKMIDIDSDEGLKYVKDALEETLPEYLDQGLPAIRTVHGYHIWIYLPLTQEIKDGHKKLGKLHKLLAPDSVRDAFGLSKNEPLPVEFKGKFQEPLPGIMYQKKRFAPMFGFMIR